MFSPYVAKPLSACLLLGFREMDRNYDTVPPLTAPSSSRSYYHPSPLPAVPFAAASSSSAHPPPRDDYEEIREQVGASVHWTNIILLVTRECI